MLNTGIPAGADKTAADPLSRAESAEEIGTAGRNPQSLALTVLAILAVLFTLFVASDFIVPIVMAIVLNLILQPAKRLLTNRLRLPGPLAALLLIFALFSAAGGIGAAISVPASGWIAKAPETVSTLEDKLSFLKRPLGYVHQGLQKMEQLMQSEGTAGRRPSPDQQQQPSSPSSAAASLGTVGLSVLSGTRAVVGNLLMLVVILFFLLNAGDSLLRRLVEVVPRYRDKRRLVEISEEIERNISGYLVTISFMNVLVGIGAGLVTWACGLPDPLLWGTMAFLLNYIPILGPFCGVAIFFVIGLFTYQQPWNALIPAGLYLGIHVLEGEAVTPMLLARRFTLNPVLVIFSLFFWDYMWGVIGALLAVPLLTIAKIVCDHVPALNALGHLLGGSPAQGADSRRADSAGKCQAGAVKSSFNRGRERPQSALMQIHGSCAARDEAGVLILGPPGSGKSDLVLRLLDRGFVLVADDRVNVEGAIAAAPEPLAGLLEVRGIGVVRLAYRRTCTLSLVVDLAATPQRLPAPERHLAFGLPIVRVDAALASAAQRVELALDLALGRMGQPVGAFAA